MLTDVHSELPVPPQAARAGLSSHRLPGCCRPTQVLEEKEKGNTLFFHRQIIEVMMSPCVAPEGEIKMSIPGAGGGWGAGAQRLLPGRAALALPAHPVLLQPKATFGRIFSVHQALFLFIFLGT